MAALLAIVTFLVFQPATHHEFINLDDPDYVLNNPMVQRGFTSETVKWAFTASHSSNWHPLTWLSHALDWKLSGSNPKGHHLTNIVFHVVNTLLLLFALTRMTGAFWRSFVVAALFALHPLHVESVAWVSERKDVLSTFFWLLTIICYVRYAQTRSSRREEALNKSATGKASLGWAILALLFFACGLMSKPMVVTLPCVLLLLDVWPLQRVHSLQGGDTARQKTTGWGTLVLEKIPFFVLTIAASVMTVWAQRSSGAVISMEHLPMRFRVENALASYFEYLRKMFWPSDLAVFYPHYGSVPGWKVALATLLIIVISVVAFRQLRRRPVLFTGWFWYLGTLVPVIGIVQVGNQALADRYTYIPLIGIFIAIVWLVADALGTARHRKTVLSVLSLLVIGGCAAATARQVQYWRNSETLFAHATAVTPRNYLALSALAVEKQAKGDLAGATNDLALALQWKPDYPEGHQSMGNALLALGKYDEALESFTRSLKTKPQNAEAHVGVGVVFLAQERFADAEKAFKEALRVAPNLAKAHMNLGIAVQRQGRLAEAIEHYRTSVKLQPDLAIGYQNLGVALGEQKNFSEAISAYTRALELDPRAVPVRILLGGLLLDQGKLPEAEQQFRRALELAPDNIQAQLELARCLEATGRVSEAVATYRKILQLQPKVPQALNNLAWLLATGSDDVRDGKAAVDLAERACELTQYKVSVMVGTLGAAYAEAGRFDDAIKAAEQARELALRDGNEAGAAANEKLIALYKQGKTARDLK